MASKEKKSGGDFVLESRHLVGLFLLLVVIFGVVFTLGYLLGRSQYDTKVRAAAGVPMGFDVPAGPPSAKSKTRPESEDAQVPKKNSDWDFYHSADPQAAADHLQPPVEIRERLGAAGSGVQAGCCFAEVCKAGKILERHGRSADSERLDHASGRGRAPPG